MRARCGASCTSGSSAMADDSLYGSGCGSPPGVGGSVVSSPPPASCPPTSAPNNQMSGPDGSHGTLNTRGSLISTSSSASKPSTAFASLAGLIGEATSSTKEPVQQRVRVWQIFSTQGPNYTGLITDV